MQLQPLSDVTQPIEGLSSIEPLREAGQRLAERGVYGFVWMGRDLVVAARYGRLVEFVAVGAHVTDSVPPLIGMERDILKLLDDPDDVIDVPAVAIIGPEKSTPRLNLSVFWLPKAEQFLLAASRAMPRSDLEFDLSRHMRARLIAESELKTKTLELAAVNAELSIANRDLEQYASVITHDLAAPLRAMRYLASDLEALIPHTTDTEAAAAKLATLRQLTLRMSQMMTALLEYASVGRKSEAAEVVDTLALARAIAASLPHERIRIEIAGDWPRVETLGAPLDLVLRNLVDNALKHHDRKEGFVRLTAGPHCDCELRIEISDDGPGIRSNERETVFMPFRRGGARAAVPGQGLGLALVRRTVQTVGGRLTLVSDPERERGSRFLLVWPARAISAVASR
jgi:signal transduction histidine kinase